MINSFEWRKMVFFINEKFKMVHSKSQISFKLIAFWAAAVHMLKRTYCHIQTVRASDSSAVCYWVSTTAKMPLWLHS